MHTRRHVHNRAQHLPARHRDSLEQPRQLRWKVSVGRSSNRSIPSGRRAALAVGDAKAGAKKAKKWAFRSRNISHVNMRDESAGCQIVNGHARIAVKSVKTAKPFRLSCGCHSDHKNREKNFARRRFLLPNLRNFCEALPIFLRIYDLRGGLGRKFHPFLRLLRSGVRTVDQPFQRPDDHSSDSDAR